MPTGYFSLILHAHLPFVRHPEYPEFLEEDWFYEAITEVYLPLIFIFQNQHEAGARPRLAMNVSPPLCEMLADPLLQERYTRHLENLLELARKEFDRVQREEPEFYDVVKMYVETLGASLDLWNNRYRRNLINAFRELQEEGVLEIITCCATHGFLPLISTTESRRAQIQIAVANYKKHFHRQPRGIWLAECAYEPGVENLLKEAGIEYFIGDSHALLYGDPRPRFGVHAPVLLPNGVAVFARDVETSQQVWSAEVGYPGDPFYREFYRDVGWDLPIDYLKPHLHKDGNRRHLGLKYFRIGERGTPQHNKPPYVPRIAHEKAALHAYDFIGKRKDQARQLRESFGGHPRSSFRRTTPSFTVTGGSKVRSSSILCSASFFMIRTKSSPSRPAIFSTQTFRFRFSSRPHPRGAKTVITRSGSTKEIRGCTRTSTTPSAG